MRRLVIWVIVGALLTPSCNSSHKHGSSSAAASAAPIDTAECAACGMVVREQPAPRAQLVHRDGTRAYFCSIGDLTQYLLAPSAHGNPEHIFVEVLASSADPSEPKTGSHVWKPAQDAFYVVGVERPGVMGAPVLSYASEGEATSSARRFHGKLRNFEQLRQSLREREKQ
ncbi:MAG: nitrous oxide reductase accessory protein NosL [Polyangiaceae bacterium]